MTGSRAAKSLLSIIVATLTILLLCKNLVKRAVVSDEQAINDSLDRGIKFLLQNQESDGSWIDFDCPNAGQSDAWVSSAIVTELMELSGEISPDTKIARGDACVRAMKWLDARRRIDGWGYNSRVSEDADSTAWALRAGAVFAQGDTATLLQKYQQPDGGIATFANPGWGNWAMSHPDVTANVLLVITTNPRYETLIDYAEGIKYLSMQQQRDGSWNTYWWDSSVYASCLAAKVFVSLDNRQIVSKAIDFLLRIQHREGSWGQGDGTAFETAMCVDFLRFASKHEMGSDVADEAADRAAYWLVTSQKPDGSWPAAGLLRLPSPYVLKGPSKPCNDRGVFTTAFVLAALGKSPSLVNAQK